MRVSSFAVARPAYYDRNATSGIARYEATGVSPHAATVRYTVTIAAGRKAFVEMSYVRLIRSGAATSALLVSISQRITTSSTYIDYAIIQQNPAILGTYLIQYAVGTPTIYAAETLTARTQDDSTGGTHDYYASVKYTEFDS